ncbi:MULTISPECIES: recombinase family protein [unclassified Clostridioides]|uniref:recombinase family protein n=1 Tax=unclassified Clostridioides TaxID=2635829 RepID=UPI001D10EC8B|nr:recombinase family protein [Clostridioides sp. ES-W-0018-02]MCC0705298.1 recombinase family protein [Clostridioides sp. ES-S-0049-02]MCC0713394.1 recombinase family protein [Clostridioides sp. ES-W-0017-02]
MIYGYCRVSSRMQLSNNSLDQQEQEIKKHYNDAKISKEQHTGSTAERPILKDLINRMKEGDKIVVTKLDRLARNATEGFNLIQNLFDKGISVHVLNIGLLENTTLGKFFITTLLAVAEMEKNLILERTCAGKEIAKQNPNFKEGRPKKYSKMQIEHALDLLENNSYTQVEKLTGISKSTLQRAKRMANKNKNVSENM